MVSTESFDVISVDTISYQGPDGPVGTPIKDIFIVQNVGGEPTLIDQLTPTGVSAMDAGAGADDTEAAISGEFDLDTILANAGGECQEPTGDPLIIGYAPDFSDLGGFADVPASQAAGYMAELINCAGGLNGTPIEYIVEPADAGDLELTLRAAQDLVDAGSHAVLGPPFSDVGLPLLNVLGGEIPAIHVASTEDVLSDPSIYSFLMTFDDEAQGNAAGEWAIKNGYQTAVTLTSSDFPYFETNPNAFAAAFTAAGGEVQSDYSYSIGDDDYSSQVNEIAALDPAPEVLYTANIMPFIDTLVGQLRAAGLTDLVIVGPDGFDATRIIDGAETDGAVYTTHGFPSDGSRMKTFLEAYETEKGEALETITFGPLGADAVLVIAQAYLASGGQLDSKAIGEAMVSTESFDVISVDTISYQGPDGPVGTPIKDIFIVQNVGGEPTL
ncbi:MAG: ABC transporter substrate-binding protein, partial [Gammaproteobacteria bacterium]|nr:ABC transporter substrate-binding protein [Gammaproteobacteria bacterium]